MYVFICCSLHVGRMLVLCVLIVFCFCTVAAGTLLPESNSLMISLEVQPDLQHCQQSVGQAPNERNKRQHH